MNGNRAAAPSRNELNSFLGLPSDGGMQGLGNNPKYSFSGDNFDVNRGTATGPNGGQAAGAAITGPQGNTYGRAVGVGANGGVGAARGVQGANGAAAGRAVGVGPDGGVGAAGGVRGANGASAGRAVGVGPNGGAAAVGGVRGPNGGAAARGVAVGPNGGAAVAGGVRGPYGGAAAGFARVTPSGRYTSAAAVRTNYNHWGVYGSGWYAQYPGAWFAAGWASSTIWRACTWGTAAAYCGYSEAVPVYYDYGTNVTYEDNSVYVNGNDVGTSEQYYDQAADLASAGSTADAPADGDWLPLGVFAFCKPDQTSSDITIQLAVNKEGILRGNYTDTALDQNQVVKGSVDKSTQRAAFTVGENTAVIETGLYNLTKDEAPCLMHLGKDQTEQWLLVRLKKPDDAAEPEGAAQQGTAQ